MFKGVPLPPEAPHSDLRWISNFRLLNSDKQHSWVKIPVSRNSWKTVMHSKHSEHAPALVSSPAESATGERQPAGNQNLTSISLRKYFVFFPSTPAQGRERETTSGLITSTYITGCWARGFCASTVGDLVLSAHRGQSKRTLFPNPEKGCGFELSIIAGTPDSSVPNSKKNVATAFHV